MILKVLLAFLLFSPISCWNNYCYCETQRIGADVDEIVIRSENYPSGHCINGSCYWEIMEHPEKDIRLEILDVDLNEATLEISQRRTYKYNNAHTTTIPQLVEHMSYFSVRPKHKLLQPPKNTGMAIFFNSKGNYNRARGFKISVKRVRSSSMSCGQPDTVITATEKMIQHTGIGDVPCYYIARLDYGLESHGGQIIFTFENMQESTVFIYKEYIDSRNVTREISHDSAILVDPPHFRMYLEKNNLQPFYTRPTIKVQYVGQRCACRYGVSVPKNGSLTLHSPGYQDINCPSLSCETRIRTSSPTTEKVMVDLLLFSVTSLLPDGDSISFSRSSGTYYRSKRVSSTILLEYVTNYEDNTINYNTGDNMDKRYYEINVTHIAIPKECYFNVYKDKTFKRAGKFSIDIPAICDFVYCSWDFMLAPSMKEDSKSSRTIIEFHVKNANRHDKVEIITENTKEIFQNDDLKYKRSHSTTDGNSQLMFMRDARGTQVAENTELSFQWRYEKIMNCQKDTKVINLTTTPFVLASQEWPDTYRNDEECRYLFIAPEDHTIHVLIDEIHLERHHDKITFYQGNTTDTVFKSFTGSHEELKFDTESNQMVFEFTSDESKGDKGFHMNLVAVKRIVTTTTPRTTTTLPTTTTTVPPTTTTTTALPPTTVSTTTVESDPDVSWNTTEPELEGDSGLLTLTDTMEDELRESGARLLSFDDLDDDPSTTELPENSTIHEEVITASNVKDNVHSSNYPMKSTESSFSSFWNVSLCFNFLLIGVLVYKYRNSLRSGVGHAIHFSRNEFGSFVSISRSEQSQQTTTTDATNTTETSNLQL